MWEVMARKLPYEGRDFKWIYKVGEAVQNGLRPTIPLRVISQEFVGLMKMCWATDPNSRPDFSFVVHRLVGTMP